MEKRTDLEGVSDNEECELTRGNIFFSIVDIQNSNIAVKHIRFIRVNQFINSSSKKTTESG